MNLNTSVSLVIPTFNEEANVGLLLSDAGRQTRPADEVIVADAGSEDDTVAVVRRHPEVTLVRTTPPVACGRNAGGRKASGEVLIFLDADVRLPASFLEDFLAEFGRRRLDVACPLYRPQNSTPAIRGFHTVFNLATRAFENLLPSGGGNCIAVRAEVFQSSRGFDPTLKFDDIELIRRLSRGRRFGIVEQPVYVSDRRYRERGAGRVIAGYALMGLFFALGKFEWANHIDYEFGAHER